MRVQFDVVGVKVERMGARGQLVDLQGTVDLEARSLKTKADAPSAGKQIQYARRGTTRQPRQLCCRGSVGHQLGYGVHRRSPQAAFKRRDHYVQYGATAIRTQVEAGSRDGCPGCDRRSTLTRHEQRRFARAHDPISIRAPSTVSRPALNTSTAGVHAATERLNRWPAEAPSRPTATSAGIVPRPKQNIASAPYNGEPVAAAAASAA